MYLLMEGLRLIDEEHDPEKVGRRRALKRSIPGSLILRPPRTRDTIVRG